MKRILLLGENTSFRRPLGQGLQDAGYEVEGAGSSSTASLDLDFCEQDAFDLVITNLDFPGEVVLKRMTALRRLRPGLKIIVISSSSWLHSDELQAAQSLGATATLARPFATQEKLISVAMALASESQDSVR